MTSRITQDPGKDELGFPKLMKSNNGKRIILMTSDHEGVTIWGEDGYSLGELGIGVFSDSWIIEAISDFHGIVELRNE